MLKLNTPIGKAAIVTDGLGGCGVTTARHVLDDGTAGAICDIHSATLDDVVVSLRKGRGTEAIMALSADVASENAVYTSYCEATPAFNSVDICVSNAGIVSACAVDETSSALWQRKVDILAVGNFSSHRGRSG